VEGMRARSALIVIHSSAGAGGFIAGAVAVIPADARKGPATDAADLCDVRVIALVSMLVLVTMHAEILAVLRRLDEAASHETSGGVGRAPRSTGNSYAAPMPTGGSVD
jgi:hypothetical protein